MVATETRQFRDLFRNLEHTRTVVLSGAGCSTESGIPDYRGPETRRRARNPITFQQYMRSPETRRRYWARATVGWPKLTTAGPNLGHEAIARMEDNGNVVGVITQNVDRLHHAAGSKRVVELHGALADVRCVECGVMEPRSHVHRRTLELNPSFDASATEFAPDGDADLDISEFGRFVVPRCRDCDGDLKPDVVFFGENVPRPVLDDAWALFDDAEALLVVGSSLTVYSGYRFVLKAAERRMPVAIVNLGPTRADELAWVKVDGRCGEVLPALAEQLSARRDG